MFFFIVHTAKIKSFSIVKQKKLNYFKLFIDYLNSKIAYNSFVLATL